MSKLHTEDLIIKLLLENEELTIRQIAGQVGVDYKSVYLKIMSLKQGGIINIKPVGNSSLCSLNKSSHPKIMNAEYLRREEALKNHNLRVLCARLQDDVKNPFFILLLFGSHVKGLVRKSSDLDLLMICDDEKTREIIQKIIKATPLKTHLLSFNSEEFKSMLKTTDFNVGKEAAKKNIILFGTENYYWLIE